MKDTKTEEHVTAIEVSIKDIQGVYPTVKGMLSTTASTIYASALDDYSGLALRYLLQIHPIHIVEQDTKLYVVAGFRSYELARLNNLKQQGVIKITCMLHTGFAPEWPTAIATADILGSPIMHSLGPKYVQQIQTLIKPFGNRASIFFPKLQSIRRIRGQKKSSD